MPVAVVALAAGSFAAGATAFAAATTLAASVAAGAMMVGSALTIVGTVTGNQKLAKIGGIVSLVGGIGTALASTAAENAASSAASGVVDAGGDAVADAAAGAATDAAGQAATEAVTSAVPAPGGIEALGDAAGSGGGMLDAAGSTASTGGAAASGGGGMLDAVQPVQGITDPLAQATTNTTSTFDAANTATGQATGNAFDAGSTAAGQSTQTSAFSPNADMAMNPTAIPADPSKWQQLQAWAKQNPELAKMAMQGVAGIAGNLVPSAKDKAMMEAYAQQNRASQQQVADAKRRALWASGRTF